MNKIPKMLIRREQLTRELENLLLEKPSKELLSKEKSIGSLERIKCPIIGIKKVRGSESEIELEIAFDVNDIGTKRYKRIFSSRFLYDVINDREWGKKWAEAEIYEEGEDE